MRGVLAMLAAALMPAFADVDLNGLVGEALLAEPRLRVYDWVEYRVEGSTVTLEGVVTSPSLRRDLAAAVAQTPGIESVENRLEVAPDEGDDLGLRVNAYWRIYGNPELRRYARERFRRSAVAREAAALRPVLLRAIHIVARDGHVVLRGEVEQERDAEVALAAARQVLGARSVSSRLVVAHGNTEALQSPRLEPDPWWNRAAPDVPSLRVEDPSGAVRVRVVEADEILVRRSSLDREVRLGDVVTNRSGAGVRLRAMPVDGARIDLDIELPYGHRLEVETADGPIRVTGLVHDADLKTGTGAVTLEAPWEITRLDVRSTRGPQEVVLPETLIDFAPPPKELGPDMVWTLVDQRGDEEIYGRVRLEAAWPERLVVRRIEVPEDSPVRMHWEAPAALAKLFRREAPPELTARGLGDRAAGAVEGPREADFRSEVRLVDLAAAVLDADNRPLIGLGPEDFEILEDGRPQEVRVVEGEDSPFNLALLLDCSASTLDNRFTLLKAAREFIEIIRPRDRAAVYVMADAYLREVSALTHDRDRLVSRLDKIPALSGSTPLYDAVVLSYDRELVRRRWERNALIVISDGMDNQILPPLGKRMPSKVDFEDLKRAAAEMNALIYPIWLDSSLPPRVSRSDAYRAIRERALSNLEELAAATGGRVFRAASFRALENVYARVAEELSSVYRLAYYPDNQDFDGDWRRVEIRVKRSGATARSRPGYYAW